MVEIKRQCSCLSTDAVGTACERFIIGLKLPDWRGMVFRSVSNSSAVEGGLNFRFGAASGEVMNLGSSASRIFQSSDVDGWLLSLSGSVTLSQVTEGAAFLSDLFGFPQINLFAGLLGLSAFFQIV